LSRPGSLLPSGYVGGIEEKKIPGRERRTSTLEKKRRLWGFGGKIRNSERPPLKGKEKRTRSRRRGGKFC